MFNKFNAALMSIILNTDSYKISMPVQYPPGTEYVYSYIEARGGLYDKTVMFGLQAFLMEYLSKPITMQQLNFAESILKAHGTPLTNYDDWLYIIEEHNGFLPLEIRAVPEGTVIDKKNVLATVVNTDPRCYWLTTHVEPALLRAIWYGVTVASNSYESKQIILEALERSGTPEGIGFKLHDFGTRGVSSFESCVLGGMAHLINFQGTDNLPALVGAMDYYFAHDVVGYSIPAMEHSTVTSWGRDKESDAYRNMLAQFAKPGAILAAVSDSYDIFNACENIWGDELKAEVVNSGATLVVRPDSGDPATTVLKCAMLLEKKFGSTTNAKGYRVLNNVRLIQGDGIDQSSIRSILFTLHLSGFSSDNIAFGQGGALLQGVTRDTLSFAMKCSAIMVDGEWRDVQKDPVTDSGKRSKKGRLKLIRYTPVDLNDDDALVASGPDVYSTVSETSDPTMFTAAQDELKVVFRNGELVNVTSFAQIRERASVK